MEKLTIKNIPDDYLNLLNEFKPVNNNLESRDYNNIIADFLNMS